MIAAGSLTIARRTSSNIKTLSDSSSASTTLSDLLGIQIASNNNNIIAAAVSKVAIHTLRGGAIDNGDPQRRKGRGYYDTDARRDYHDADSRRRGRVDRDRPPQRPSRADLRGQSSDDSPKRDARPQQKGDNRDRRYNNNRYDDHYFDDRPNNRKSREDDDFNKSYDRRESDHQRSNSKIYQSNNINTTDNLPEGKKKKWFSRRKDTTTSDSNDIIIGQTETGNVIFPNNNHQPPPPPPPPPPPNSGIDINPADTERVPIHYMFPTAESAAEERQMSDTKIDDLDDDINTRPATDSNLDGGISDVPYLDAEEDTSFFDDRDGYDRRRRRRREEEDDEEERGPSISARRDAVTIFMSTKRGAIKVRIGSTIVGIALGAFVGKVRIQVLCVII